MNEWTNKWMNTYQNHPEILPTSQGYQYLSLLYRNSYDVYTAWKELNIKYLWVNKWAAEQASEWVGSSKQVCEYLCEPVRMSEHERESAYASEQVCQTSE